MYNGSLTFAFVSIHVAHSCYPSLYTIHSLHPLSPVLLITKVHPPIRIKWPLNKQVLYAKVTGHKWTKLKPLCKYKVTSGKITNQWVP